MTEVGTATIKIVPDLSSVRELRGTLFMPDDPTGEPETPTGAYVEIYEPSGPVRGPIKPRRVRINGTDVGFLAAGGIQVKQEDYDGALHVLLDLLPRRVEFKPTP